MMSLFSNIHVRIYIYLYVCIYVSITIMSFTVYCFVGM